MGGFLNWVTPYRRIIVLFTGAQIASWHLAQIFVRDTEAKVPHDFIGARTILQIITLAVSHIPRLSTIINLKDDLPFEALTHGCIRNPLARAARMVSALNFGAV